MHYHCPTFRHNTKPLLYITSLNDTTPLPDHTKRCITIAQLYHTSLYLTLPKHYYAPPHGTSHNHCQTILYTIILYPTLPYLTMAISYFYNYFELVHILLYTKSTSTTILLSKQYSFYLTYCLYYCKSTYLSSYTRYILQ